MRPLTNDTVVESCGAIPDLEDKEGEVTGVIWYSSLQFTYSTLDCLAQSRPAWPSARSAVSRRSRCRRPCTGRRRLDAFA